ncbi:MAG: hypothetical protein AAFQ75_12620 [Pseudomonadota bacterium]
MRLAIVTALAAGSLVYVQPSFAAHSSCAGGTLPAESQCAGKDDTLSRIGDKGGTAVCRADDGAPFSLQYDRVAPAGYQCSHYHSCTWALQYDPEAWKAFCEIDEEALEEEAKRKLEEEKRELEEEERDLDAPAE